MKTDSLFYEIFQTDPSLVFDLIGRPPERNVTYRFASQEVKQTSFRIDGILVPPTEATDLPIVFVEVQGYRDSRNVLYSSFFSQIFLYLHDYQPLNDWYAVLIFIKRSLDPGLPRHYRIFEGSSQFQRIYLDELNEATDLSLGLSLLQLIGLEGDVVPERGRKLISRTYQEIREVEDRQKFIELIETVFVYKFPSLSREDIETMLGLSELKQTRVYQEALEEGREEGRQEGRQEGELRGKLAAVPLLLKAGLTAEQIAEQLQVDLAAVQQMAVQDSDLESREERSL